MRYPPQDEDLDSLPARARAHKEGVGRFQVDYDFRFTDDITRCGITFVNRPVDDAGLFYKPDQYDHGNRVAAADVDCDRLTDPYFVSETGGNELWKHRAGSAFNITQVAEWVCAGSNLDSSLLRGHRQRWRPGCICDERSRRQSAV